MENWRQYVFSLIACVFICGILSQIISDPKRKALMHLISGVVLAISVLQPLSGINLEDYLHVSVPDQYSADSYIAEGEQAAFEARKRCITAFCETYILDKAKALGIELMAEVSLNDDLIPVFVELTGDADTNIRTQLQTALTTDLGIPKENQKWILHQENSSS